MHYPRKTLKRGKRRPATMWAGLLCIMVWCAACSPATRVNGHTNVQFIWTGAVTPVSATVVARLLNDAAAVSLVYSTDENFADPQHTEAQRAALTQNNRVVKFHLENLKPATRYYYKLDTGNGPDKFSNGTFQTFPDGPASFSLAFGSCSATGSVSRVFTTIAAKLPLFFLRTGDTHYENIGRNDRNLFRGALEATLMSQTQDILHRSAAVAYVWDDHDYGPNNSDATAPGRSAARLTYQEYVPHYPLAAGSGDVPIYQAFSVGRVRFILTDLRSERDPDSKADGPGKSMMGRRQKEWFFKELLQARDTHPLIVWVSTVPWISSRGDDNWAGYAHERREISQFIVDNDIRGLCMLCGDAHMLAIDDGTNTNYSDKPGRGFPLMHAAALDRTGSRKGGPYSHGMRAGGGQFGWMTVNDKGGDSISVVWSGRDIDNDEVMRYEFSVPYTRN